MMIFTIHIVLRYRLLLNLQLFYNEHLVNCKNEIFCFTSISFNPFYLRAIFDNEHSCSCKSGQIDLLTSRVALKKPVKTCFWCISSQIGPFEIIFDKGFNFGLDLSQSGCWLIGEKKKRRIVKFKTWNPNDIEINLDKGHPCFLSSHN